MEIEELRESGDEQDEQDDRENGREEEREEGQEEQEERQEEEQRDEVDEQDDEVQVLEDDEKLEEADVDVKNRQENRANSSHKSSKQSRGSRAQSRAATPQNQSRTLNNIQPKRWRSANAFVNFVQDFKQDYPDMITGRNIFQTCGERWKSMTDEQKQPYIAAANTVKRLKNRKIGESSDQQSKKSVTRVSKRKAETKRKETSQKRLITKMQ
ncbi:high mobility group B protein 2-like isoform X2 [Nasonia vitripennis]|uniref:HMG box domain-containing protein n=1 Tax=Nasonia vitripennis TaxID=7425 RepID=A0A7M7LVB0_NASVI|nr:high mobility group B protein 2-like isoform X2 [Nasonia vitripennis]